MERSFVFLFFLFLWISPCLCSASDEGERHNEDHYHPYVYPDYGLDFSPDSKDIWERARGEQEEKRSSPYHDGGAESEHSAEGGGKRAGASPPRRLDFFSSAVQMGAQFVMYPSMGRMLEQQTNQAKTIVKGVDTRDLKIQVYRYPEECLVVFDTIADQENGDNAGLGLIDANTIEVLFSYGEHEGQFIYTEKRQEKIQFLKFAQKHVQRFDVPRGCVGTKKSKWRVYCQQADPKKPCYAGRVEIFFSRVGKEDDLTVVPLESPEEFIENRMEKKGENRDYFDILDWFETPTPDHRMIFDTSECLLHFHFSTSSSQAEKSRVFWLKNRQGIRVDVFDSKGEIVARKTAIPPGCGVAKVSDIEAAQKQLEDSSWKILLKFQKIDTTGDFEGEEAKEEEKGRGGKTKGKGKEGEGGKKGGKGKDKAKKKKKNKSPKKKGFFKDTVVIPKDKKEENGGEIRPAKDFEYYNEDQLDFVDFFPERNMISLDDMERVKLDP